MHMHVVVVTVVTNLTIFRSLLRVYLIKWVSNVRMSIRTSTRSFFDFNEIWYVMRVMHDGMQYDPIHSQGHEPVKVREIRPFSVAISSTHL